MFPPWADGLVLCHTDTISSFDLCCSSTSYLSRNALQLQCKVDYHNGWSIASDTVLEFGDPTLLRLEQISDASLSKTRFYGKIVH
jgi:hypothetical protein